MTALAIGLFVVSGVMLALAIDIVAVRIGGTFFNGAAVFGAAAVVLGVSGFAAVVGPQMLDGVRFTLWMFSVTVVIASGGWLLATAMKFIRDGRAVLEVHRAHQDVDRTFQNARQAMHNVAGRDSEAWMDW